MTDSAEVVARSQEGHSASSRMISLSSPHSVAKVCSRQSVTEDGAMAADMKAARLYQSENSPPHANP
jgi:hypothetical protein